MVAKAKKIKSKKQNKIILPLIIVMIIAVFGLAFGAAYLINQHFSQDQQKNSNNSTINNSQSEAKDTSHTEANSSSSEDSSEKASENSSSDDSNTDYNPQKPIEYEGGNANTYAELTGYISNMAVSNNVLSVRAIIDQSVNGTCAFVVTSPSGTIYNKSVDIEMIGTAGGCIIDIPLSKTEAGTYKITADLSSARKSGKITGEIKVE